MCCISARSPSSAAISRPICSPSVSAAPSSAWRSAFATSVRSRFSFWRRTLSGARGFVSAPSRAMRICSSRCWPWCCWSSPSTSFSSASSLSSSVSWSSVCNPRSTVSISAITSRGRASTSVVRVAAARWRGRCRASSPVSSSSATRRSSYRRCISSRVSCSPYSFIYSTPRT